VELGTRFVAAIRACSPRARWPKLVSPWALSATFCLLVASAAVATHNDDYQSASRISLNTRYGHSNVGATVQDQEPMTAGSSFGFCREGGFERRMQATIWYRIKGTGGPITITTAGSHTSTGAQVDTLLGLYNTGTTPIGSTILRCSDDESPPSLVTATISRFASQAGKNYLVQIGGSRAAGAVPTGSLNITALANDDRAWAETTRPGSQVVRTNAGSSTTPEVGENTSCPAANRSYGRTVWFRFKAPRDGKATFRISGGTSVLSLYRGASTTSLGCTTATLGPLKVRVARGQYFAQIGTSDNAQLSFSYSVDFTPPRLVPSLIALNWGARGNFLRPSQVVVTDVLAKSKITLTCRARRCPFKRKTKRVRRRARKVSLTHYFRRSRFGSGDSVQINVLPPSRDRIGIAKLYRIRGNVGAPPRRWCVNVSGRKVRCPS
jgi:hypothetical protein